MEEQKKTEEISESEELSRADFLKMAGAAGLGIAGLSAIMSSPASAQEGKEGKKKKYLFVITSGSNDPNRAILSLLLADTVQKRELGNVHIYMALEGAELCKKGAPEKIISLSFVKAGNAFDMMERIRKNGGKFAVCPPCADRFSAIGDQRIDWVENQDGIWFMEIIQDSIVSWL
ncbi:MAG: hypothetical protein Q8N12_00965 [Thermodesulfovibrionales bacterium]|nr:hypothetical protein [Thermodesulfovibrionales bacterium]